MTSISDAARGGSRRELLMSMRDRIAFSLDNENTAARDLASLTRRLMEISKEIEQIDAQEDNPLLADFPDEPWDASR